MLQQMDRLNDIPDPVTFFNTLYDQPGHKTFSEITADLHREGYMRVRKVGPRLQFNLLQYKHFR